VVIARMVVAAGGEDNDVDVCMEMDAGRGWD
jgi:hypothetical protein